MTPTRRVALAILAAGLLLPAPGAAQQAESAARSWLRAHLQRLAGDRRLGGAKVNMIVTELGSGRALFARDADRTVPVASNVKLVTAAAALAYLGPAYRFRTAVYLDQREGPVAKSPLILKGFGDPTLGEGDLWRLACSVFDKGIRELRAGLQLDESFFDDKRLAPLFETRKTDMYYRPLIAPLSIHENAVAVKVHGGEAAGDPTRLELRPQSSYLKVRNRSTTVRRGRRSYLDVTTRPLAGATRVDVKGRVRVGYRSSWERRRIEHPALLAGHTLLDLLQRRGVRLRSRRITRGAASPRLKPLAVHRSAPLGTIVRYMTKTSSNFVAEMVLKVLGAEIRGPPATWPKGLAVAERFLRSLKIRPGSYAMKNGSGLYEGNRLSPHQLATVIRAAASNFRYGADYVAALAIAGVDGTLAHRFIGTGAEGYLRAKTGTLAAVVALSGIAGALARRDRLVFSILITELPPGHIPRARQVADEMARALVTFLERER